jgi:hypothetical protein
VLDDELKRMPGYKEPVPIREFYQFSTVYKTAPVSSYFEPEAGYIMSEKVVDLG